MAGRRTFLKLALGLGAAGYAFAGRRRRPVLEFPETIKPHPLAVGQTLGLVAPGSNAWEDEEIRYAVEVIESLGFRVKTGKHLFERYGYLAGEDQERADDLNRMFANDRIDAIMCLRGGYGSTRILPFLNYKMIRRNPKPLIGYSDITALLNAINRKTGLVTFHGPIARQEFSAYTLNEFKRVMITPEATMEIGTPPLFEKGEGKVNRKNRLTPIYPGKAQGQLIGGNLTLITKLIGTPYEPDYRGKILFLEDIYEEPRRIDAMLTHLWLAGKFEGVAGVVFGKCTECEPTVTNSLSLEQVLIDRFAQLKIPTLRGLMIGHVDDFTTVPIGIRAELDVEAGKLRLLEKAVG